MVSILSAVQALWSHKRALLAGGIVASVLCTYLLTAYVTHKTAYSEGYCAGVLSVVEHRDVDAASIKERIHRSVNTQSDSELDTRLSQWLRD